MNRGSGLLQASQLLAGAGPTGPEERDFVWRNLHKCALGCGDALLIAAGQYDFDLSIRRRRLPAVAERLGDSTASRSLCECYEAAVAFKAHPSRDVAGDASGLAACLRTLWRQVLTACLACRVPKAESLDLLGQLASDEMRQGIKDFSNWPTIPQLYINGEFIGGSDILYEMYQSGELQGMLEPYKA